jgi:hypothetical protein
MHARGYTIPGQGWTYWNKGPGPGEEEYLTSDETEWSNTTGVTAAQNLFAVANALSAHPMGKPAGPRQRKGPGGAGPFSVGG